MTELPKRTARVTGAAGAIGKAIVSALRDQDVTVAGADRRSCDADHVNTADLMDPQFCDELPGRAAEMIGRLDILVNNAGLLREGTALEMSVLAWEQTLHADQVRVAASDPENGQYREYRVYRTSWVQSPTSGLLRASRADAVDHGPQGVRCNSIAPSWIDTELNAAFIESRGDPEEVRASIGRIQPVGRTGIPDEVAGLARWLVSEESGFITGQTWTVDWGAQEPVKPSLKAA